MPIYEYVCQDCGNEFERIQTWSDTSTPTCSACASSNVVRLMSPPAIHFKGSGWYVTDSKKGNKNGAVDHSSNGKNGANKNGGEEKSATADAAEKSAPAEKKESADKTKVETT